MQAECRSRNLSTWRLKKVSFLTAKPQRRACTNARLDAEKRAYSRSVRWNLHASHIFPDHQPSTGCLGDPSSSRMRGVMSVKLAAVWQRAVGRSAAKKERPR